MRIDSSQKTLLAVLVLAIGTFVLLGWYPAHRDIKRLRAEIDTTVHQLSGSAEKTKGHPELHETVQRLKRELAATSKTIPHQGELAGLIREVSTRAEAQQLREQNLSTKPTVESAHYVTLPVEILCRGDALAAFGYVNQLEQMPQLVQLTGLYLSSDPDKSGAVETRLTLNTFFYASPKGISR